MKTIKEYVELCNKLDQRVLELISMQDIEGTEKEIEEITATKEAERPEVTYYIYKNYNDGRTTEKVTEFKGLYYEGHELFNKIKERLNGEEFDIVYQKDVKSHGATTQTYKVNQEEWVLTFTREKTMQSVFEEWSRNLKTDLKIISTTWKKHKVVYSELTETATFY